MRVAHTRATWSAFPDAFDADSRALGVLADRRALAFMPAAVRRQPHRTASRPHGGVLARRRRRRALDGACPVASARTSSASSKRISTTWRQRLRESLPRRARGERQGPRDSRRDDRGRRRDLAERRGDPDEPARRGDLRPRQRHRLPRPPAPRDVPRPRAARSAARADARATANGRSVREITLADAERRSLAVSVSPLARARTRRVSASCWCSTTSRELKQARDHAARLRRQRQPRAADAAHGDPRLRRDLARRARSTTATRARQFLAVIDRHSERLSRLIDDLLTLSDLELGKTAAQAGGGAARDARRRSARGRAARRRSAADVDAREGAAAGSAAAARRLRSPAAGADQPRRQRRQVHARRRHGDDRAPASRRTAPAPMRRGRGARHRRRHSDRAICRA